MKNIKIEEVEQLLHVIQKKPAQRIKQLGNFYIIYNLKGEHRRQGNLDAINCKKLPRKPQRQKGGRGEASYDFHIASIIPYCVLTVNFNLFYR